MKTLLAAFVALSFASSALAGNITGTLNWNVSQAYAPANVFAPGGSYHTLDSSANNLSFTLRVWQGSNEWEIVITNTSWYYANGQINFSVPTSTFGGFDESEDFGAFVQLYQPGGFTGDGTAYSLDVYAQWVPVTGGKTWLSGQNNGLSLPARTMSWYHEYAGYYPGY